jgi:hypothetical protein
MLLPGSAEVVFPSRTTTIATAANLPTHDTATYSSYCKLYCCRRFCVMSALTTTASDSLPKAAAASASRSVATPSTTSTSDAFAPTVAVSKKAVEYSSILVGRQAYASTLKTDTIRAFGGFAWGYLDRFTEYNCFCILVLAPKVGLPIISPFLCLRRYTGTTPAMAENRKTCIGCRKSLSDSRGLGNHLPLSRRCQKA